MPNDAATLKAKANPLAAATAQLGALFEESGQAMYLYLDDHDKACNQRFATLLGYASPAAWAAVHTSFPTTFVAPKSQGLLVETYQAAVNDGVAAQIPVTWRRKDGKTVDSSVILAPVDVDGRRFALHFITPAS
jgi:PAS domain-containing protein